MDSNNPFGVPTRPRSAGNGFIMRLAPVPMYYAAAMEKVVHYSAESSRTTHGTAEAVDACKSFGVMIAMALHGETKEKTFTEPEITWTGMTFPQKSGKSRLEISGIKLLTRFEDTVM